MQNNQMNRRNFIKGAVATGAMGGLLLAGCSPTADASASSKNEQAAQATEETQEVTSWVDAVSSASIATNKYTNLQGEDLIQTINSFKAECTFATTNEDGTPNIAVFAGGLAMRDEYIIFVWTDNQTKANLKRDTLGMISFDVADLAAATKEERHKGARVKVEYVDDEALRADLAKENENVTEAATIVKIVEVLPIG